MSGPAEAPRARARGAAIRTSRVASFGIPAYRDDGPISLWLGRLVEGRIPPIPPLIVGLFVTSALAALGMSNLSGVLLLTPVEAMLLAGLGSSHPHNGRLDWLVPALIQVGEYLFLAALAFTHRVASPLVFTLVAAVVLRHLDVAYRARHRIAWPAPRKIRTFVATYRLTWPPTGADGAGRRHRAGLGDPHADPGDRGRRRHHPGRRRGAGRLPMGAAGPRLPHRLAGGP